MKFLVLWSLETGLLSAEMVMAVLNQQEYTQQLQDEGKLPQRFHIPKWLGGACVYDVSSDEELDRLLLSSPVFNFANHYVYPLAEMDKLTMLIRPAQKGGK